MADIYVALDIEMTGPDPEIDEIIEIGAIKFRGDKVLDTWHTFVKPSIPIPYKIQALTGITDKDLKSAPLIHRVLPDLVRFIKNYPIVGQSIERDMAFLAKPALALGIKLNNREFDTFELATLLLNEMPKYDLQAIAQKLGVKTTSAHRALVDAEVSMKVFLGLIQRLERLDEDMLTEIASLAAKTQWQLADLFQSIAREKVRHSYQSTGSSIRDLLVASGSLNEVDADFLRLSKEKSHEPLRASAETVYLDTGELSQCVTPGGLLDEHYITYEHRPEQEVMLRAVADAFNNENHLLVEAGTGTGKTLAYLIPALKYAYANNRHVVISTKTISLQEQLLSELHQLTGALDAASSASGAEATRYCVLKGRSNYLCLRRWLAFRRQQNLSQADVKAIVKLMLWLLDSENGDVAEMRLTSEEESSIWPRVASTSETCLGQKCPNLQKNRCFYQRARRKAESSHVIVVNHALLISDMISEGQVLPKYEHLIIDEAHDLEDEATNQMAIQADSGTSEQRLQRLAAFQSNGKTEGLLEEIIRALGRKKNPSQQITDLVQLVRSAQSDVRDTQPFLVEFFQSLAAFSESYTGESNRYARKVRLTSGLRVQPAWSDIEVSWESLAHRMESMVTVLKIIRSGLEDIEGISKRDDLIADLDFHIQEMAALAALATAATVNPDPNYIYWLEQDNYGRTSICGSPLNVGARLREEIFEQKSTVVLTSATLTTQNSFDYIRRRVGIDYAEELVLGSSFDYKSNALLCVASDMPEPGQPGYQRWLEQSLINLCTASEGRALVLFTSHTALRNTYRVVQPKLEERGILVLGQAIDGSRSRILARFKHDHRTVLFGTASFWEGIDIAGEALSLLVITKLPFSVPTDPVFAARAEEFEDGFENYSVPQAILKFKQGFGRLIRSHQDKGSVVILDRRVLTRGYGTAFVESLPACRMLQASLAELPEAVAEWLNPPDSPGFR